MDLFKILKHRTPISVSELFCPSPRTTNFLMLLPKINLEVSRLNFVFSASSIWNSLIGRLLNKCSPNSDGIMVTGSSKYSDMSAPISYLKKGLKETLLSVQKLAIQRHFGESESREWSSGNFFKV